MTATAGPKASSTSVGARRSVAPSVCRMSERGARGCEVDGNAQAHEKSNRCLNQDRAGNRVAGGSCALNSPFNARSSHSCARNPTPEPAHCCRPEGDRDELQQTHAQSDALVAPSVFINATTSSVDGRSDVLT